MQIELLDYLLDENENFWIVTQIDEYIHGYIVYKKDENGNRFNSLTNSFYTKLKYDDKIIPEKIIKIFKPQQFFIEHKKDLTGIWKDYVDILNKIGISDLDIGIFGSYLVGFNVIKDVDFVIYGYENLLKYYNNVELIHKYTNTTPITKHHIDYQYNKFKDQYNKNNDLLEIISRNWSAIQIKEGVLSTPRFIIKERQQTPLCLGENKLMNIKIIDGLETSCFPRYCKCEYNNEIYELYSNLWKYQSFANTNEYIQIYANIDDKNNIIIINDKDNHYLKY